MHLIGIDLDGTLEDSRDDMVAAARRVRAQLGLPERADDALAPWVNAGMDRLYRACFDDFIGDEAAAERLLEVQRAYEADYLDNVAVETRLYDGIAAALDALSPLGTLACVTNKPEHISRALLDALGVAARFSTVVGGDSCAEPKPSPLMLRTAAERVGFEASDGHAFMIGDTAGDAILGRAYGAITIWCAWGYSAERPAQAEHAARSPAELAALVTSCLAR